MPQKGHTDSDTHDHNSIGTRVRKSLSKALSPKKNKAKGVQPDSVALIPDAKEQQHGATIPSLDFVPPPPEFKYSETQMNDLVRRKGIGILPSPEGSSSEDNKEKKSKGKSRLSPSELPHAESPQPTGPLRWTASLGHDREPHDHEDAYATSTAQLRSMSPGAWMSSSRRGSEADSIEPRAVGSRSPSISPSAWLAAAQQKK